MHRIRCVLAIVLALVLGASGQSAKQKRPASDGEIVAQEVILSGTTTLNSSELAEISSALSSVTMNDNDEEVGERIKYEFMQHGYYDADVTNLTVTVLDALAKKKPVKVEADVSEGPQFRLAQLIFKGDAPSNADELRAMFSLKPGDVFNAEKVRLGLETMRQQYAANGFLGFAPVPNTEKTGHAQITLTINIDTGPQFRTGELKFAGPPDEALLLRSSWELKEGEPYDPGYLDKFITKNRGQLPETFDRDHDVIEVQDCPQRTVSVTFELDPKAPRTVRSQYKPCEKKEKPTGE